MSGPPGNGYWGPSVMKELSGCCSSLEGGVDLEHSWPAPDQGAVLCPAPAL